MSSSSTTTTTTTAEAATPPPTAALTFRQVLDKSAASAMRGGVAGAAAMAANVGALMWIRTTVRVGVVVGTERKETVI
jgi:purine nucleoside permease